MKKILVPIDFSEVSGHAANFAIEMAEKSNAQIVFLNSGYFNYFVDFPVGIGVNTHSLVEDVVEAMKIRMKEFIEGLKTNVKIESKVSQLHLLEAVKEIQETDKIGLIVMGTNGSSGWSELIIGSNTEKVVRWAKCPVISVPSTTHFGSIKKILIAIDLKEVYSEFLEQVAKLQQLFDAEMDFIWIKTPHNMEDEQLVSDEIEGLLKRFKIRNSSFSIVKTIFPTDGIFMEAEKIKADMIAMATHSRRGIAHWLNGSITEDTINHVSVPVWTFKIEKEKEKLELFSVDEAKARSKFKTKSIVS